MMFFLSCALVCGIVGMLFFFFAKKAREHESLAARGLAIAGGIFSLFTVGFLACVVVFVLSTLNGWWSVNEHT